jgi:hypothetical protein
MKTFLLFLLAFFIAIQAYAVTRKTVTKNAAGTMSHVTAYVTDGGPVSGQTVWIVDPTTGVSFFANIFYMPDAHFHSGVTFLSSVTFEQGATFQGGAIHEAGTTSSFDNIILKEIHAKDGTGVSIFPDSGDTGFIMNDGGFIGLGGSQPGPSSYLVHPVITAKGSIILDGDDPNSHARYSVSDPTDSHSDGFRQTFTETGDAWNLGSIESSANSPYYLSHYSGASATYFDRLIIFNSSSSRFATIDPSDQLSGNTLEWGAGLAGIAEVDGEMVATVGLRGYARIYGCVRGYV